MRTSRVASEQGIDVCAPIPVHGFVNGLAIGPRAKFCVAADEALKEEVTEI